jgi:hypothetical protein
MILKFVFDVELKMPCLVGLAMLVEGLCHEIVLRVKKLKRRRRKR